MASIKNSKNVFNKKMFIVFVSVIAGVYFLERVFSSINDLDTSSPDISSVADGYTIDSYKVTMNVNENNVVDVTEEITINWYEEGHHGIYKFTPEWYEYTASDNKTIKRKSKLTNYVALDETYVVDRVKNKPRIKIGTASTYLSIGPKEYTISYNYDMGKDPFKTFDAFIFHTFGDYWGTTINNASLEIRMPRNFDMSKVSFWADKYRENEITSSVNYYVNERTLYASVSSEYNLTKSLTVDIELPEDYFVGGSNNYGNTSLIICLAIIGVAVISFFRWLKYGKDHNKVAQPVEFYPPEDYDAAQIGYIYGKQTSKKLAISLIVQLASKGYIQINESKSKKKRTIINLYPIHSKKVDKEMKNENPSKLTETEQIVYNALFSKSDKNDISTDTNFYTVFDEVANSLEKKLKDAVIDKTALKYKKRTIIWLIIGVIAYYFAWSVIEDMNPSISFFYFLAFISLFATTLFIFIMGRKTEYGETITARVLGFRNYIEKAEKNQIEKLVEENPNYFYDILPYAYAMNVSQKWVKNFEDIPLPPTSMGNFDYGDMSAFSSISDSIHYPSSSGSGSSCGGGCSSCGGGCSSCGGGGSW